MPKKLEIQLGSKIGNLTLIKEVDRIWDNRQPYRAFECLCDCGNSVVKRLANLKSKRTKKQSCGCLEKKRKLNSTKHGHKRFNYRSPEYRTWTNMKIRCYNPKHPRYQIYGARGIKVHDSWLNSFENFYEYIGKKPTANHSIDRIDVNGNYEPGNVRWATAKEQANNRR